MEEAVNKNELINEINFKSGLSKKDCKLCLETMINVIKSVLQNGESLTLSNFGKFKVNDKKAKTMYNFKTKNTQIVEARKLPIFKASENLKQSIK